MNCERTNKDVMTVLGDRVSKGWSASTLLISDVHFDSKHCQRQLLRKHLNQAVERDAAILAIGDIFDIMGGRGDTRRSKSDMLEQYNQDNMFDLIVEDATEFFLPYASRFVAMGDGNHEKENKRYLETDLLARLCDNLDVEHTGYSGWVRYLFGSPSGRMVAKRLVYHHGYGAGSDSSNGAAMTRQRAVLYPDADIVATAHIHKAWYMELSRYRISEDGAPFKDTQYHVQLATYKDEGDMSGGYITEKGGGPAPLGGWWLDYTYDPDARDCVGVDIRRAA